MDTTLPPAPPDGDTTPKTLTDYVREAHEISKEKGFWPEIKAYDTDEDQRRSVFSTIPMKLALIHSEVSEALELYREWGTDASAEPLGFEFAEDIYMSEEGECDFTVQQEEDWDGEGNPSEIRKPIGWSSELADILIRTFDLAAATGVDLEKAVREKMRYNRTRPFRHGKKQC